MSKQRRDVQVHTWQVGPCRVTLTVHRNTDGSLTSNCDWDPATPEEMTDEMEAQWQAGLHMAIAATRAAFGQEIKR